MNTTASHYIRISFYIAYGLLILVFILTILSCKSEIRRIDTTGQIQDQDTITDLISSDTINEEIQSSSIDYDTTLWTEILSSPTLFIDLKYASTDNFTKEKIYDCDRCFLRPHVADAFQRFADDIYDRHGLGLILYDCYRPRPYQQKLWDIIPDRRYVTPPEKGSMHNRGMAIDVGLIDSTGQIMDMGSAFDHFGPSSFHSATDITKDAIQNRKILLTELARFGFKSITSEWWHYSYRDEVMPLSDWVWACY